MLGPRGGRGSGRGTQIVQHSVNESLMMQKFRTRKARRPYHFIWASYGLLYTTIIIIRVIIRVRLLMTTPIAVPLLNNYCFRRPELVHVECTYGLTRAVAVYGRVFNNHLEIPQPKNCSHCNLGLEGYE